MFFYSIFGLLENMLMENTTTEEKYKKLAYLFEKYKGHKFKLFEPILFYFQKRGDPSEFTIKPHIHWYYKNIKL